MRLDPDGLRLLCCAVIKRALLDMRSRGEGGHENIRKYTYRSYVEAVLWLGSSRASVYFDYAGAIEQTQALYAMKWASYAMELKEDPRANLTEDEMRLLTEGIEVLQSGIGRA